MSLFWSDPIGQLRISYRQLIDDLNDIKHIYKYIYFHDPYEVYKYLIGSLCFDEPVTLLDGDFSSNELKDMGISNFEIQESKKISSELSLKDFNDIRAKLDDLVKWNSELFTSGTTGTPKSVKHTFENLTRSVRIGSQYEDNIWALTYNPTHFAGLQVFFQAFLNQNQIHYLFETPPEKILSTIRSERITNLSFTPTFFRQLIPYMDGTFQTVMRITFGGEKFEENLLKTIKDCFPNAKVNNVYASTEAGSLFASEGEYFRIPDQYIDLIKVNSNNELMIHRKLLGNSEESNFEGDWYKTGDIVELIEDNKMKFESRASELINVGGYNVHPTEVEKTIFELPFVKDVLVKPRKSSVIGHILVAEIVLNEGELDLIFYKKTILDHCRKELQEWKVPRIIRFVEELELTRSGKKKREG